MAQVGKLYIDVDLLARQLNFPPEHGIVGMGFDPLRGGFLIVTGPSLPAAYDERDIVEIALQTTFFGNGSINPNQQTAEPNEQVMPRSPFGTVPGAIPTFRMGR